MTEAAAAAKPAADERAGPGLRALCLAVIFLSRLEVSVLTLVIPHIAAEFRVSLEFAAWVNFLPAFTGTMFAPSVGKFSDMYGHARTWQVSLLLLAFSTWLSAWSPSLFALLLGRGLTGFAGCGVMSPSLPLMSKGMDKEQRGAVQSTISTIDALGSSIGVLCGGFLIDSMSWRVIFLIPAPLMTAMWLLSHRVLPRFAGATGDRPAFDWVGTVVFAVMSFCLLFSINRGNDDGWGSPTVLGLASAALLLAPVLAGVEKRAAHPVLPIWLFGTPERMLLTLTSAVTWSCYGSVFLLVPVYLQEALKLRAGFIGNLLAARPIAGSLASAAMSALIARKAFRMRSIARCGSALQLLSYTLLNVVGRLQPGETFYALLELQLMTQAVGAFSTGLPTNAMFVATLAEGQLANVVAMRGVMIGLASLCVQTSNLSLIRALGSEFKPENYRPTWSILACLQLLVVFSTLAVPASAELGAKGTVVAVQDEEKGAPEKEAPAEEESSEEEEESSRKGSKVRVAGKRGKRAAKAAVKLGKRAVGGRAGKRARAEKLPQHDVRV